MASTAITPQTLEADTFARKVMEEDLVVTGPVNGYLYAQRRGVKDAELYRTLCVSSARRYYWTYTCRFTETGAGGGTNTVKLTPGANSAMRLISMRVTMCDAAAGRATQVVHLDEDGATVGTYASASIDQQYLVLPSVGGTASSASNIGQSCGLEIPGDGSSLAVTAAALAQNEYFDVSVCFELIGTSTAPTVTHTSTGTASTGTASQDEVTEVVV